METTNSIILWRFLDKTRDIALKNSYLIHANKLMLDTVILYRRNTNVVHRTQKISIQIYIYKADILKYNYKTKMVFAKKKNEKNLLQHILRRKCKKKRSPT